MCAILDCQIENAMFRCAVKAVKLIRYQYGGQRERENKARLVRVG